jgi:beta-glucosidase
MGLFDNPYVPEGSVADKIVSSEEHNAVSLRAARECLTLLKNQGSLLPLDRSKIKSIAVIGPNADNIDTGRFRYGASAPKVTTVRAGIENLLGKTVQINYAEGCKLVTKKFPYDELYDQPLTPEEQKGIAEAVALAQKSDVIIAVVGGCSGVTSGESRERTSLNLPGRQEDLLKALHATGKPVVMVLITGNPMSINWSVDNLPAILLAWYPGAHGGTAIAEALFGDYNPGGKSPGTFPKTVGQIPMNFPCKPGSQANTSRTMARVNGILYCFGHGLSYTTFDYSKLKLDKKFIAEDGKLTLSFDVTNTGKRDGDEVPQLYIRDVQSSISMYEKMLRGFERVHLKAGETKTVSFTIDPKKHLWLCNEAMQRVVEPGEFKVMIGSSSEDIRLNGSFVVGSERDLEAMQKKAVENTSLDGMVKSASYNPVDKPAYVIDGDRSTRWTSGEKDAWIELALGEDHQVSEISIQWYKGTGRKYKFEIQSVSSTGSWDTVFKGESSGKTDEPETYKFKESVFSDAIRVVGHGSDKSKYTSIEEITIPGWSPNE